MKDKFIALCEELKSDIEKAYTEGVTLDQAERLAAKFLGAQMDVADKLRVVGLDTRMRKSGLKAVKAAVYLEEATRDQKKPSDVMLQALVDRNEIVSGEQTAFDEAEVSKNQLENYLDTFKNAHIYFRGMAKGRFE